MKIKNENLDCDKLVTCAVRCRKNLMTDKYTCSGCQYENFGEHCYEHFLFDISIYLSNNRATLYLYGINKGVKK